MRKRPSRGEGAVSALIDAENGHGLGQCIDRFLMLARVVQGLSVRPQLLHLGQLLGTEGGACGQGVVYLLHVHGAVEGEGAAAREQGGQQQHESHLSDLHVGFPSSIAPQGEGIRVEGGGRQGLP